MGVRKTKHRWALLLRRQLRYGRSLGAPEKARARGMTAGGTGQGPRSEVLVRRPFPRAWRACPGFAASDRGFGRIFGSGRQLWIGGWPLIRAPKGDFPGGCAVLHRSLLFKMFGLFLFLTCSLSTVF